MTALKLHGQQQDSDREQAGDRWADTGLVLTTRFGTPIEPRNFTRTFDRRTSRAKPAGSGTTGRRESCGLPSFP